MILIGKKILITGASGLVGVPTVRKCLEAGANVVAADLRLSDKLAELKSKFAQRLEIVLTDLTYLNNCEMLFKNFAINSVLHIAGVKGSPVRSSKQPCDYLFPMLMFNTNMIKASYDANVDWFVYMSSVGVYQPAELMREDDVWSTVPSKNDWYPGWTKRMGEAALESLKVQYGWDKWTVIRPSNIYGINDNFSEDATVISSNIWKLFNQNQDFITCWGDGSARRDFVYADDLADATIDAVNKKVHDIVNFGCGTAVSIKDTIQIIVENYKEITGRDKEIRWDSTKTNGDPVRCLSAVKQEKYGLLPKTSLTDGIYATMLDYKNTKNL